MNRNPLPAQDERVVARDPEAITVDWEAGQQRYFTRNWIQLAATWAAFGLFLAALILL